MAAVFASLPCKVLWRLTQKEVPDEAALARLSLGNNTKVRAQLGPACCQFRLPNLQTRLQHAHAWASAACMLYVPTCCGACVQVVFWMPQNDLLAHPHTRAFLSHVGVNSQYEVLFARISAFTSQYALPLDTSLPLPVPSTW